MMPTSDPTDDSSALFGSVIGVALVFLILLAVIEGFAPMSPPLEQRLITGDIGIVPPLQADPS